ncbi:hypothetical protein TFLX_04274 [Thermoflexales bacterium]|nr:hypothetical protein TFLX_04274 [Thermoflexales bacterium]
MSNLDEIPQPNTDTLLKEYELCQKATQGLETTIWQTSGAMGIGLIGTLILVASHIKTEQPPWPVAALIGLSVFLTSLGWFFIARRWWSIQHAYFIRMRHIEERLGIYAVRYLYFLDNPAALVSGRLSAEHAAELGKRSTKRRVILPIHQRFGVQRVLSFLPVVIFMVWVLYVMWLIIG